MDSIITNSSSAHVAQVSVAEIFLIESKARSQTL